MKTALIFIGQTRTFERNKQFYLDFVSQNDCDVYVSSSHDQISNIYRETFGDRLKIQIFDGTINGLIINNVIISKSILQTYRTYLIYSIMKGQGLWDKYDCIIKTRPDLILSKIPKMTEYDLTQLNIHTLKERSQFGITLSDIFAFGNATVMAHYFRVFEIYEIYTRPTISNVINLDGIHSCELFGCGMEIALEKWFFDSPIKINKLNGDISLILVRDKLLEPVGGFDEI